MTFTTIQIRRDTETHWHDVNPILAEGEYGFTTDTRKLKIGDGTTDWNTLAFFSTGSGGGLTDEDVRDIVGALVSGQGFIQVTYNDSTDSLVIEGTSELSSRLQNAPMIIQWNGSAWAPTPSSDPDRIRYYDSTGYSSGVTVPISYNQADKWFRQS